MPESLQELVAQLRQIPRSLIRQCAIADAIDALPVAGIIAGLVKAGHAEEIGLGLLMVEHEQTRRLRALRKRMDEEFGPDG